MKKWSHESILTGSEKVNHKINGMKSLEKDCIKKSKKQRSQDCSKRQLSPAGSVTKDEEEVVETLYALAGMFPDNESNAKSELDSALLRVNSSVMQDQEESANATFEAFETTQNSSLFPKGSHLWELQKSNSLNETNGQEHIDFARSAKFLVASHTPMVDRNENGGKAALHDSQSELCLEMGSYAAKGLDWLNYAIYTSKKDLIESCSSGRKISEVVHKKSWKSCAAHVYISNLIQSLEVSKRQFTEEPELAEHHQMGQHQGSKSGVLMEAHYLNGTRDRNSSAARIAPSATARNSHETNNGILQKQFQYCDMSQALPTLAMYGPQKQNFNFLSLSTGSNELKVNDCFNKGGSNMLEPLSQSQVSYFESL